MNGKRPSGIEEMFQQAAMRLKAADLAIRAAHTGKPVEYIVGPAAAVLADSGVNIADEVIRDYAESVSADTPFRFDID